MLTIAGFVGLLLLLVAYTRWQSARIGAAHAPRGDFVTVEAATQLHYTHRAALGPERATVLLLHGASGNQADLMLPLGARLSAKGFRVLAFDRPGHGWSERPDGAGAAQPERQAQLIAEALAALGISRAIVVGHSLGGVLASALALNHTALVDGLVLVAPVTHPWPNGDITWYYTPAAMPVLGWLFTETVTLPAGQAAMAEALRDVFAPQPVPDGYAARTGVDLVLRPATFRANAQDVAQTYAAVCRQAPRLGQIRAPTAIVTGDSDRIVLTDVHSYGSARDIPDASLRVLEGVGHSPHWSAPEAVVAAIEDVAQRARVATFP
jgi:pimeloyl-ACP methyl ester carboxylesterase